MAYIHFRLYLVICYNINKLIYLLTYLVKNNEDVDTMFASIGRQ